MSKIIINGKEYNSSSGIIDTEFTSNDTTNPTEYTDIDKLSSGESIKSILNKISTMFKNIRYLYKLLGNTDISSISNGTITGAIKSMNNGFVSSIVYNFIIQNCTNEYSNDRSLVDILGNRLSLENRVQAFLVLLQTSVGNNHSGSVYMIRMTSSSVKITTVCEGDSVAAPRINTTNNGYIRVALNGDTNVRGIYATIIKMG